MRVFSSAAGMVFGVVAIGTMLGACSNTDTPAVPTPILTSPTPPPPPPPPPPLAAPALAFTAPGQSLDLANYTLTAQYDLPVGSGANLLGAESSAVTYNGDTDTLFITSDHGTSVFQVSKTGQFIDTMTLPADASQPQGTALYDLEGIAYVGNGQFVVTEERYRQANRFRYVPNTTLDIATVQRVKLGTTLGNIGIEGIAFDPFSGGFVVVKEKTPLGIYQTSLDFAAGTASNGSATTENSVNLFDPALAMVADFGDIASLSNTLPSTAADYADLAVLSQESGVVLKMNRAGQILSRLNVGIPAQHEGIAFDRAKVMYLANELGGGSSRPQLWVYTPTTSASAVGIGSNVYLTFAVPVVAGIGNLVISNGSGDTRTIAISDADQVRFSGNTLTVNPSMDLLPGTLYSVQAPAGAVRAASGGNESAAVAASFTTRNETVPPTLLSSMPADNALAVNGSRVVLNFSEPVVAGSGNIVLSGAGGDVRTLAVGDATQVTISGNTVDIKPSADLQPGTAYNVQIARDVIRDQVGNPYAGLIGAEALNFTTASAAGGPPPTTLNAGDVLFMGINGDAEDAIAFVLLRDVTAGSQVAFTDKDYTAGASSFSTNEAAFTWTADVAYPAGTIVTIQTNSLISDVGAAVGTGGGISTSAETYYAFQGSITDAGAGQITVDRFLAAINLGAAAGDIPPELPAAGAFIRFDEDNARYMASLDRSDLAAFAARVKNTANWERNDAAGYPLNNNSLFGSTPPPPPAGSMTTLNAGEVLFMAMNGDPTDAFAFVILKDILSGTEIAFTDKNYTAGAATFPTNEAAFTWTADAAYPAGTLVTIQVDPTLAASRGTVSGTGGGISTTAETYYAFQGRITNASTGEITVDRFLAAINLGAAAGDIPPELTSAGAFIRFDEDNAKYTASLNRADLAAFTARVKDTASYSRDDAAGYALTNGSFYGGTALAAGDVLFMAANADAPDAIAFVILKAVVAGTEIGFTDKNYTAGAAFPNNEAAFTWTADVAYPAGTIVTISTDALTVDRGTVYGAGGGISPNAETYYAFQGTILNPAMGQLFVDRFLAAINIRAAAGEIPAELTGAGSFIRFDADNMRYSGSLDRSDLAAFATRVKNTANWETNDATPYPTTGGSLFP